MKRFNRSMNSYMFNKVRTMAVACGIAMVSGNICGLCGTNTPGTGDATGGGAQPTVENHDNCVGINVVNNWKIHGYAICDGGKLKENLDGVFVLKTDRDNAIKNAAKDGAEQALKKYDKISEFKEGDKLFIKCSCESTTYYAYVEVGSSNGIGKITLETLKAKKIKSSSSGSFIFLSLSMDSLKEKDIDIEVLFAERKS